MSFDECFLKTGTVGDCLFGNGENDENITCDTKNVDFSSNPSAKQSLINWLTKKPPTPEFINGPLTLTRHTATENGIKKYVYIFGEFHGLANNCDTLPDDIKNPHGTMDIQDFFTELIESTPVFLDIFLETGQDTRGVENYDDSYIHKLVDKVKNYIPPLKGTQNPEYRRIDNVRIHAADIRPTEHGFLDRLLEYILNVKKSREFTSENMDCIKPRLIDLMTDIKNLSISEYIKKYLITPRVEKELNRLTEHERTYILDLFNDFYGITMDEKRVLFYNTIKRGVPVSKLPDEIMYYIVSFEKFSMDIYLLARMFKTFNTRDEPNTPHNSIIYSGDAHSVLYRQFFNDIGYEKLNLTKYEKTPFRCLCVDTDVAYPLFGVENCPSR